MNCHVSRVRNARRAKRTAEMQSQELDGEGDDSPTTSSKPRRPRVHRKQSKSQPGASGDQEDGSEMEANKPFLNADEHAAAMEAEAVALTPSMELSEQSKENLLAQIEILSRALRMQQAQLVAQRAQISALRDLVGPMPRERGLLGANANAAAAPVGMGGPPPLGQWRVGANEAAANGPHQNGNVRTGSGTGLHVNTNMHASMHDEDLFHLERSHSPMKQDGAKEDYDLIDSWLLDHARARAPSF